MESTYLKKKLNVSWEPKLRPFHRVSVHTIRPPGSGGLSGSDVDDRWSVLIRGGRPVHYIKLTPDFVGPNPTVPKAEDAYHTLLT